VLFVANSLAWADGVKNKFGQGFKIETPAEIYPEQFLNVKNHNEKDNSTKSNIDPIKNTYKLKITKDEVNINNSNSNDALSFKKIEDKPVDSNPMFPDREFRGSHNPDFVGTALGLTIGK
jgi:hypothetical protein